MLKNSSILKVIKDPSPSNFKKHLHNIADELIASAIISLFSGLLGGIAFFTLEFAKKYYLWFLIILAIFALLYILTRIIIRNREKKWFLVMSVIIIIIFILVVVLAILREISNTFFLIIFDTLLNNIHWIFSSAAIVILLHFSIRYIWRNKTKRWIKFASTIMFFSIIVGIISISYPIWENSPIRLDIPQSIVLLATSKTPQKLEKNLNFLNKKGEIAFGNRSDFVLTEHSSLFVIIADRDDIYAILQYAKSKFIDIKTEKSINTLSNKYSGKRQIWIQTYGS
ncbi:MAG: hypothetical protein GF353_05795 [Candidatus Lokiarchaeota archaeon]|nr:hypothetical protein [Candidatus Lokiarchaeota archaeon]